jgi:PhzF family phenazine biosynthesis protein
MEWLRASKHQAWLCPEHEHEHERRKEKNMKRSCKVVDVFTAVPFMGNPVAVILDAEGLDTHQMQAIAGWTNLSETTFVLPPSSRDADYRLRIFTPRSELPFAGHPTLGSAHAILEAGRATPRDNGRLVQECDMGLVALSISGTGEARRLSFELPPARINALGDADLSDLQAIVGRDLKAMAAPATVNVGPTWVIAQLEDADAVIGLRPDLAKLAQLERRMGVTGLTVFGAHPSGDASTEVRTFAPSSGVNEDPVCGSGNGSVAAFLWARGLLPAGGKAYVATQGRCVGRNGRIAVSVDSTGGVLIGGACVTCIDGAMRGLGPEIRAFARRSAIPGPSARLDATFEVRSTSPKSGISACARHRFFYRRGVAVWHRHEIRPFDETPLVYF